MPGTSYFQKNMDTLRKRRNLLAVGQASARLVWIALMLNLGACIDTAAAQSSNSSSIQKFPSNQNDSPQRKETRFIPNLVQLQAKVYSGGLPEGDDAFAELQRLGFKTIISVDGAKPDVKRAEKFGLRYVHLPHGYDGISKERALELGKAVSDLDGPIYVHCHHGKHRSPAAATVACVVAGLLEPEKAIRVLQLAGTSPHYVGLYKAAADARSVDSQTLQELQVEFVAIAPIPPMAEAMVLLEKQEDLLRSIADAGWEVPDEHPDLVPAHQALLFREQFTEMLRMEEMAEFPDTFMRILRKSEANAKKIEEILHGVKDRKLTGQEHEILGQLFLTVSQQCKQCHLQHRDAPVSDRRSKASH